MTETKFAAIGKKNKKIFMATFRAIIKKWITVWQGN